MSRIECRKECRSSPAGPCFLDECVRQEWAPNTTSLMRGEADEDSSEREDDDWPFSRSSFKCRT